MLRKLHDHEERAVLGAGAQQVDDVDVAPDDLDHVHLRHQVDHLGVRVTLLEHLDRHHVVLPGVLETEGLGLEDLAENMIITGTSINVNGYSTLPNAPSPSVRPRVSLSRLNIIMTGNSTIITGYST